MPKDIHILPGACSGMFGRPHSEEKRFLCIPMTEYKLLEFQMTCNVLFLINLIRIKDCLDNRPKRVARTEE